MKEIIGNESNQFPFSQFDHCKNREIFDKREIAKMLNNYFVSISPNFAASIPESKTTFQNYLHCDGPCLSTINLTNLELGALKQTKVQVMMMYLPMLPKKCPVKYLF